MTAKSTHNTPYIHQERVYYDTTDASGWVYHGDYLRFAERARTEMLRSVGISGETLADEGTFFAVHSVAMHFNKPAHLDDLLTIETTILAIKGPLIKVHQEIKCGTNLLVRLTMTVAYLSRAGRPQPLPAWIREKCTPWMHRREGAH